MATSSIFSSVKLNDKESAERFVDAIESSKEASASKARLNRSVIELDDKGVKDLFKEK